jgi:hypothetical protein
MKEYKLDFITDSDLFKHTLDTVKKYRFNISLRPLRNSQFLIFISTFTIFQKRLSKIIHIFHKNLKIACLSSFFLLCFFIFNPLPLIRHNNPVDDSSA